MKKFSLIELDVEKLGRGWVFRCKSSDHNEDLVDLLIRENLDSPSEFTLMIMSGYNAGCDLVNLPADAGSLTKGLSKKWIIENWEKWIYPACQVEEVIAFRLVDNPLYQK